MTCQVYFLHDPLTNEVFYVGIGKPGRAFTHVPKVRNDLSRGVTKWKSPRHQRIASILERGAEPRVELVHEGLTKEAAKKRETSYIAKFGRLDLGTGCLTNRTKGGEWINDCPRTEEWLHRMSESGKVAQNRPDVKALKSKALKGKKRTAEQTERIKTSQLALLASGDHPKAKQCVVDGVAYPSIRAASRMLGIPYASMRAKLLS